MFQTLAILLVWMKMDLSAQVRYILMPILLILFKKKIKIPGYSTIIFWYKVKKSEIVHFLFQKYPILLAVFWTVFDTKASTRMLFLVKICAKAAFF